MALAYKIPGVYRQDVYVRPVPPLPTGVPAFVGLAKSAGGPVPLFRAEDLAASLEPAAGSYLADAVAGFFANGGARAVGGGASRLMIAKSIWRRRSDTLVASTTMRSPRR